MTMIEFASRFLQMLHDKKALQEQNARQARELEMAQSKVEYVDTFVDPAADDGGDGSMDAPANALAQAVQLAADQGAARLILCDGLHANPLVINGETPIRTVVGGYECGTWLYVGDDQTLVQVAASKTALKVTNLDTTLELRNITFETRDAADGYYSPSSTHDDVIKRGPFRGHPLTGPVLVEGAESGTVVEVLQKGYRFEDQLIRPARVVVSA